MKRYILTAIIVLASVIAYSQMKFMGIPIDGPKSDMIEKLEKKGFTTVYEYQQIELLEKQNKSMKKEQRVRYNDEAYWMEGFFNGKKCIVGLYPYKGKMYRVFVAIDHGYMHKSDAFGEFNSLAEKLNRKYPSVNNYYNPLDYSDEIEIDGKRFNFFLDEENQGVVSLLMTYPSTNLEYHIVLEYSNILNAPDDEDL